MSVVVINPPSANLIGHNRISLQSAVLLVTTNLGSLSLAWCKKAAALSQGTRSKRYKSG